MRLTALEDEAQAAHRQKQELQSQINDRYPPQSDAAQCLKKQQEYESMEVMAADCVHCVGHVAWGGRPVGIPRSCWARPGGVAQFSTVSRGGGGGEGPSHLCRCDNATISF